MKKQYAVAALILGALVLGCSDSSNSFQPPSSLTVVPTAAPEGAAGEMPQLTFRVTLTSPQLRPVLINYETVAGTAVAGEDYLHSSGQVEIPSGGMEGRISVDLVGDGDEEAAETFSLQISTSDNSTPTATAPPRV